MPLSTVYNVTTRYRVDGDSARRDVSSLSRYFDTLSDSAQRTKRRIEGLWRTFQMGAVAGVTGGLALGVRRMFQLGQASESARIAIGGTFAMLSDEAQDFNAHLEDAEGLFESFGEASLESPFKRDQFLETFQAMAPGIAPLGLDDDTITEFVGRGAFLGEVTGQDRAQVGRQLEQILTGATRGQQNQVFRVLQDDLFDLLGVGELQELNELAQQDPHRVFDALAESMESLDPALEEHANSFQGLRASIVELFDEGVREAWGAFENEANDSLRRVRDWLQENIDEVRRWGRSAGELMASTWERVGNAIVWVNNNSSELLSIMGTIATIRAAGLVKDLVELTVKGAGSRIMGLGQSLIELASGQRTPFSGAGVLGLGGGGAAGVAAGGKVAGGSAMGVGAAALLPLLPIVGGHLMALFGAFNVLQEGADNSVGSVMGMSRSLAQAGDEAATTSDKIDLMAGIVSDDFFASIDRLVTELDVFAQLLGAEDFKGLVLDFSKAMGIALVRSLSISIDTMASLIGAINDTNWAMMEFMNNLRREVSRLPGVDVGGMPQEHFDRGKRMFDEMGGGVEGLRSRAAEGRDTESSFREMLEDISSGTKDPDKQPRAPVVDIDIHQNIRTEASPDRIALRAADVVGRKTRHSIRPFAPGL